MAYVFGRTLVIGAKPTIAAAREAIKRYGAAEAERWFEEGPVKECLKADAKGLKVLLPYAGEFCREYDKLVLYAAAKGESKQLERLLRMEGGLTKARVKKALDAADDAGQDATVEMLMGLLAEAPIKYVPEPLPEGQIDMPAKEAKELFAIESRGPASVAILRYRADAPEVVVPARINGKRVVAICARAFSPEQERLKEDRIESRKKIRSVALPEGLVLIGKNAFRGCGQIRSVALPEGLVLIGEDAFRGCRLLSDAKVPSGCAVGENAFRGVWAPRGLYAANYPAPSADSRVGDVVAFGAARWRILALDGGRVLLHACDIVCDRPYDEKNKRVTWELCDLRAWLNGEYLDRAFSEDERARIVETSLRNPDNVEYGTRGGATTADRVFLLSIDEARAYYSGDRDRSCGWSWWLRSPGERQSYALSVQGPGWIDREGSYAYYRDGVRPAIWLNL